VPQGHGPTDHCKGILVWQELEKFWRRRIPWGNEYGLIMVFERGNHIAYRAGNRDEAERQIRLALGDPASSPKITPAKRRNRSGPGSG
jgi:hypothetical protein